MLVVAGLLLLFVPGKTLLFVGILVGVQLVLVGLIRIWALRAFHLPERTRLVGYALAALTIVVGLVCMMRPGASLLVVALLIGAGWLADGVMELVAFATDTATDRSVAFVSGVLSVLGGLAVLFLPGLALVTFAQVAGVFLLVFGVAQLAVALRRRPATAT